MKMINILLLLMLPLFIAAQDPWIELTFVGVDGTSHRQLDSIHILNLESGTDTTLFWPDTVLIIPYPVGIKEDKLQEPSLSIRAYPNPFSGRCHLEISIPCDGEVTISVSNILGRITTAFSMKMASGLHAVDFIPGNDKIYLIALTHGNNLASLKLISLQAEESVSRLVYQGLQKKFPPNSDLKFLISNFTFSPGEELLLSGYSGGLESVSHDSPDNNKTYTLQFAQGIPCPGDSVISYLGKDYPTVQVFGQCWLQKNLDAGVMIDGMATMSDNGVIEKYCMANDPQLCEIYGGLYQWDEMMQYTTSAGVQGICPQGWHLPTDLEWRILEGTADSQYGVRDGVWDSIGFRGYDAGDRLKSDSLWKNNMNGNNATGFNALPSGTRGNVGFFLLLGENAPFWSSSTSTGTYVWYRVMTYNSDKIYRYSFDRFSGFGVRCLRD